MLLLLLLHGRLDQSLLDHGMLLSHAVPAVKLQSCLDFPALRLLLC